MHPCHDAFACKEENKNNFSLSLFLATEAENVFLYSKLDNTLSFQSFYIKTLKHFHLFFLAAALRAAAVGFMFSTDRSLRTSKDPTPTP